MGYRGTTNTLLNFGEGVHTPGGRPGAVGYLVGEEHRGLVYFTVDNFANLLNDDWGKVYDIQYPQQYLFAYDVNDAGQYVYDEPFGGLNTKNYDRFQAEESTWRVKVGLKYQF